MIATTIMISTRVKPPARLEVNLFNIAFLGFVFCCVGRCRLGFVLVHNTLPSYSLSVAGCMNREILSYDRMETRIPQELRRITKPRWKPEPLAGCPRLGHYTYFRRYPCLWSTGWCSSSDSSS